LRGKSIYLAEEGIGALQIGQFNGVDLLQFGVPGSDGHVQALAGDMHLSPISKQCALFSFLFLSRARREAFPSFLFQKNEGCAVWRLAHAIESRLGCSSFEFTLNLRSN
jgi:hypothetical protein